MKKLCFTVASTLFLNALCPGRNRALPAPQTASASAIPSLENESLLGLPAPLATATLAPPATPKDSSLGINTVVPEFASKRNGASPTSESSSVLLFSMGLFVLSFLLRSRATKKILHVRLA